ncbi:MAG: glycosyltransferase family 4 protein [Candidatus Hydrogenedentes bacterium]|nr:glycosyltransferase family 4 protein [Candidatus Hydrogenedentota bacterium]
MSSVLSYQAQSDAQASTEGHARLILASGFQPDYVREVANAHARLGHAVRIIGGDMHEGQEYHPNVALLNLRGSDKRDRNPIREFSKLVAYYAKLIGCVASTKGEILYDVSIGRPLLRCMLMYPLFRLLGKRIVYTAHNVLPHDADTIRYRIIYWIVYRALVDAIVVHGQAIKERLVDEFDVDTDRVHVVAHGTYHPHETQTITKAAAREHLGIAEDERVLLCFGLQRYYKGTHFVIESLGDYHAEKLTLLVRGHAPERSYQDLIERMARTHRGPMRIDAKFGAAPDSEMEFLFKAADVVLLPYLEGSQSGIKFMAYAYGRPVLASGVGSLREYVQPGVTGEVFSCGEHAAFRAVLEQMLANLSAYAPDRIMEYACEHCSFDTAARQVDAVCRAVTKRAH